MSAVIFVSKMMSFSKLDDPGESMGMAYKLVHALHDVVSYSHH
jgi:hypothetical protein